MSSYLVDLLNISGPYGVGKDTLLQTVLESYGSRVHRVSTLTTRPTSPAADPSYTSLSQSEFLAETSRGDWLVNYQLSGTVAYATSMDEINRHSSERRLCIHSIYAADPGAGELRRRLGHRLISVGVLASPGGAQSQPEALRHRLVARGRDDQETIRARLNHQKDAIDYILANPTVTARDGQEYNVFDQVIINDDLSTAKNRILDIASLAYDKRDHDHPATDYELYLKSGWRSYGGGVYFNPTQDVPLIGRKILIPEVDLVSHMEFTEFAAPTYVAARLFSILNARLQEGEILIGAYIRGNKALAPLLGDAVDLVTYENQVRDGQLSRSAYYAMPEQVASLGFNIPFPPV